MQNSNTRKNNMSVLLTKKIVHVTFCVLIIETRVLVLFMLISAFKGRVTWQAAQVGVIRQRDVDECRFPIG